MRKKISIKGLFFEYGYIFFLFNLATLVPMLQLLGEQFAFFTAHELTSNFIVSSICVFAFVIPLLFSIVRSCLKRVGMSGYFDGFFVTFFLGLYFLHLINKGGYGILSPELEIPLYFAISVFLTLAIAFIIIRKEQLGTLSLLSLTIPMAIFYFVVFSPASIIFQTEKDRYVNEEIVVSNPTPVFLIVFDEFSGLTLQTKQRVLDKERYPNWAEFLEHADYYPNALTSSSDTTVAVPGILTGNHNKKGGLDPNNNLLEMFAYFGPINSYSKVVSADLNTLGSRKSLNTLGSDLLTLYLHMLFHKDWAEANLGVIPQTWADFGLFQKKDDWSFYGANSYDSWIDNALTTDTSFNFLHILFPHAPHILTPTGKKSVLSSQILAKAKSRKEDFGVTQSFINVAYHSYMLQSAYTDKMIEQLITGLKDKGVYQKSLIIITSDHGVSYDQKGVSRRVIKTKESWANIISIPLFIKYPYSEKGAVNDAIVTSLDIVPTIWSVLGMEPVWKTDGESLQNPTIMLRSNSVQLVPQINEYDDAWSNLFSDSLESKSLLFGEGSSLSQRSVNYSENSKYDVFLDADISSFDRQDISDLSVIYNNIAPIESEKVNKVSESITSSFEGIILENGNPVNDKVMIAALNNKIVAIFETSKVQDKHGTFAFYVAEDAWRANNNKLELYALDKEEDPVLLVRVKLQNKSTQELEQNFNTLAPIRYNWKNAIKLHSGHAKDFENTAGGHKVRTSGKDPYIVFKPVFSKPEKNVIFYIEIESDKETVFSLFYKNSADQKFGVKRKLNHVLKKGDNSFYIEIPDDFSGAFRFDLGMIARNTVYIKDVQVRSSEGEN